MLVIDSGSRAKTTQKIPREENFGNEFKLLNCVNCLKIVFTFCSQLAVDKNNKKLLVRGLLLHVGRIVRINAGK